MEKRFQQNKIEIREAEGKTIITGYAAVFDSASVDLGGFTEYIRKGAFNKSLKESHQKALWNHNSDYVLGNTRSGTLKLWEDEIGLAYELDTPNTQAGRDLVESVRRGDIDGNSFGFNVVNQEWDESNPSKVVRYLNEVNLFEISPTAFPAYPETSIGIRSAYEDFVKEKPITNLNSEKLKKLEILRKLMEV